MFNLANDRLSYGNILLPPNDYYLDFAIGTTYSLDLNSLLGVSLSFLAGEIDRDMMNSKVRLLESLIKNANKIALFCENGQIHFPKKGTNPLHIFLEDMIFQVTNQNYSKHHKYASFHPKFWLLRFKDDDENILYRIIVLSRNLTFDRSWDISLVMDGEMGDENDKNLPLIAFINYLSKSITDEKVRLMSDIAHEINDHSEEVEDICEKVRLMRDIANELKHVQFSLKDSIFDDFEFIVNGIGNEEYQIQNHSLFKQENFDELCIISPFLSKKLIKRFNDRINTDANAMLITKSNSLLGFKQYCSNFEVYTVRNYLVDGEKSYDEGDDDFLYQDIHAKIYLTRVNEFSELYLGSLNTSCNALESNVELMVKLTASSDDLNVVKLKENLFNVYDKNPFELVDWDRIEDKDNKEENDFNDFIKYFVRLNSRANVIRHDDYYDIELVIEDLDLDDYDWNITIQPFFANTFYKLKSNLVFEKLSKNDLSKFFKISINDAFHRVVMIPTDGLPKDRYDDAISTIIDNEVDFMLMVSSLLGDDFVFDVYDGEGNRNLSEEGKYSVELPELYEQMLKTIHYHPERFDDIDELIGYLSEENIPDSFKQLYDTFKRVREKNECN